MNETENEDTTNRKARTQRRKGRKEEGPGRQQHTKETKSLHFFRIAGNNNLINLPPLVHEVDSCDRVGP